MRARTTWEPRCLRPATTACPLTPGLLVRVCRGKMVEALHSNMPKEDSGGHPGASVGFLYFCVFSLCCSLHAAGGLGWAGRGVSRCFSYKQKQITLVV